MSDYTKDPFDRCYDGAVMDAVWAALGHWAGANMKLVDKWKAEERTSKAE